MDSETLSQEGRRRRSSLSVNCCRLRLALSLLLPPEGTLSSLCSSVLRICPAPLCDLAGAWEGASGLSFSSCPLLQPQLPCRYGPPRASALAVPFIWKVLPTELHVPHSLSSLDVCSNVTTHRKGEVLLPNLLHSPPSVPALFFFIALITT